MLQPPILLHIGPLSSVSNVVIKDKDNSCQVLSDLFCSFQSINFTALLLLNMITKPWVAGVVLQTPL